MTLTKQDEYSVLFLAELSNLAPNDVLSLIDFSHRHGISALVMKRIAGDLRKKKIVVSREGARGGYRLAKPMTHIRLNEIFEALPAVSVSSNTSCPLTGTCTPRNIFRSIRREVTKAFHSIQLSAVIQDSYL